MNNKPIYFYLKEKIKANFNPKILKIFKEQGFGFEVVSKGELKLALSTKINPQKIIFNGNGKTYEEVKFAIENGVEFFNFDSLDQLLLLEETAKALNKTIKALMRIKPLVDKVIENLEILNFGGGFAISMNFKEIPKLYNELSNKYQIFIEPGRYLIADAGFILTKVISIKSGYPYDFLVIDCGMSELIRPALYSAYHPIRSLENRNSEKFYIVVGQFVKAQMFLVSTFYQI